MTPNTSRVWLRALLVGVSSLALVFSGASPASADDIRQREWHLAFLHVAQANTLSDGSGVVVAVLDTGIDATHRDLVGSILTGLDLSGSGSARADTFGHGTAMASLIVGHGHGQDHGSGVLGVAPGARILPIRLPPQYDYRLDDRLADGLRWAVDHGARVVSISQGTATDVPALRSAVAYAVSRDVVVVASAGNATQGDRSVVHPASYPGVLAVSAVDRAGNFARVSVRGPEVSLAAPGQDVVNAQPGDRYGLGTGTSDSAALVSGVAALVRSKYPRLNAANVVNRLIRTARDAGPPERDPQYGFGVVDAYAAVTASVPSVRANPLGSDPQQPEDPAGSTPAAAPRVSVDRGSLSTPLLVSVGVTVGLLLVVGVVVLLIKVGRRRRAYASRDESGEA